jgi:hypothetical protein
MTFSTSFFAMLATVVISLSSIYAQPSCDWSHSDISHHSFWHESSVDFNSTKARFFLNYETIPERVLGFDLVIHLYALPAGSPQFVTSVSESWILNSASYSHTASYDANRHCIRFKVLRADCTPKSGIGFIGELIINHASTGSPYSIQSISGGIILMDNIDAG